MKKILVLLALLIAGPAAAQWQVPINTIPIGRGPGVIGFNSVANTGTGSLCLLNSAPPTFGACPFTLTVGATTIAGGTNKGLLYNNAGVLGNLTTVNNGVIVTNGSGTPLASTTLPASLSVSGANLGGVFYYTSGGVIANTTSANNALLATSAAGVPSITTTLPAGLTFQSVGAVPSTIAGTATLTRFFDGSAASPHVAATPSVSISRYEAQNAAGFTGNAPALYIETTANSTGAGNPNVASIVANTTQIGVGDAVGIATNVTQSSATAGYYAYGAFFAALATTANSNAATVQTSVNALVDNTWSPSTFLLPGWAVSYDTACNGPTTQRCAAAYEARNGGNTFDVGFAAMQLSVRTTAFQDDSASINVLKATGTHTKGVTFVGAAVTTPFESLGFSVNSVGAVTITNGFNINGLTSGVATIVAQSVAGSSTATLGTNTGTVVVTATSPLTINTATGNITCTTCVTSAPTITLSGDVTGSGTTAITTTLATVNSNVGTFGSATQASQVTVNGKGLITAASNVTITPAIGSITGLGTGVATALGVNIGSAGAPVLFNGAGGTPSSITLTNASGTASSLVAGIAGNLIITDDTTTNATMFPMWVTASSGNLPPKTSSTKLSFNPSTGLLTVTGFSGSGASLTSIPTTALTGTLAAAQSPAYTGDVTKSSGSLVTVLAIAQPSVHTWALAQTFTVAPVFTDQSGSRTALGLGTAATQNTGTSGANLPFLNGTNTFSGANTFSAGVGATSVGTGTVILSSSGGLSVSGAIYSGGNQVIVNAAQSGLYLRKSDNTSGFIVGRSVAAGDAQDFFIYDVTAAAARLSITSGGAVTIAQTLSVTGMTNVATTSAVCYNTGTGLITYDGTLGTCTVSDERLKDRVGPIENALTRLLTIEGFYYTWRDPSLGSGRQIGVGAQTVERAFPELVSTDSTGRKSADYQRLTAPIIEALRELKADNDNLRQEFIAFKNANAR